ncbi:DUF3043 domain-containing protein [Arcanobacterium hippocoleae]|uniref:DUF3043 domain-containing protein n=1 Tax=Arcanobacterium hippocoleae TaxID=149017 RepID=A0ABU1T0J2_9ACTO|nr:DUF3043 domain-containing protein [Arcanobacterium hippocoleae]MDR6938883.1 hypothetical protein [Arcanobacterium hippocoleae]
MFGKKSSSVKHFAPPADHASKHDPKAQLPKGYNPPKGSATPKRKEAQARNKRPLISNDAKLTKEERKERRRAERQRSDEIYRKQQEALRTGDEANLPYQYKGKVRRWGRDYIDASGPISAWFMPLAIMILPLVVVQGYFPQAAMYLTIFLYAMFGIMAAHAIYLGNKAKRIAREIFGDPQVPRGYTLQLISRCFYPRRWRLPKPMVKRGEFPAGAKKSAR